MEPGIGKFLKPVGEGGTQDPLFVSFSVLANLDRAEWRQSIRRLNR
jgi:hypothetical protein